MGRCSGLPGLRQAFPGPGGADPGYVEHRPVCGAGVRKLVAARYARFREFAPLRLARLTGTNRPNRHIGEMRRDVSGAFPTTPYMCARQHGPGMILPASRRGT